MDVSHCSFPLYNLCSRRDILRVLGLMLAGIPAILGELRAVGEALNAFKGRVLGKEIQICSDNATAVAYLNHQGRTRFKALLDLAKEIFSWAEHRVPPVRQGAEPQGIPGIIPKIWPPKNRPLCQFQEQEGKEVLPLSGKSWRAWMA